MPYFRDKGGTFP